MRTILTTIALMFFFLNAVQSKHHYTFHSIVSLSAPEVKEVQFFIEAQLELGDRCRYSSKINAFEVISAEAIEAVKIKNALNKRCFFIRVDEAQMLVAAGTQKSAIQDEDLALRRAWFAIHHNDFDLAADAPVEILTQTEFDALHPQKKEKIQALKTIVILP